MRVMLAIWGSCFFMHFRCQDIESVLDLEDCLSICEPIMEDNFGEVPVLAGFDDKGKETTVDPGLDLASVDQAPEIFIPLYAITLCEKNSDSR